MAVIPVNASAAASTCDNIRLLRDNRGFDCDLLGMGALTAGLQNSEDRIAERKIDYTVTNGTDDAGEIPPEPQWKLRLLVLPRRTFQSAALKLVANTLTTTSPGAATGSARSP